VIAVLAGPSAPNPPTTSNLSRSEIVVKHNEPADYLFYAKGDGSVVVSLDGYLICPMDMFTPRQLRMAKKRYAARSASVLKEDEQAQSC
jgi:hypothetical protein